MATINLLSNLNRVETPFVKVIIDEYTLGVYSSVGISTSDISNIFGKYSVDKIVYPNYIQSLEVQKINGTVNTYKLNIIYPITQFSDPNYFEKIFSSVSKSRRISFAYGDLSSPTYIYKNETAIIIDVQSNFQKASSTISYTISAISDAVLSKVGKFTFPGGAKKPSDVIKSILWAGNDAYGLQELFYGMRNNRTLVEQEGLIASDDAVVQLESKQDISVLDYINYLVDCMEPLDKSNGLISSCYYTFAIIDDTTGKYGGPYFKIKRIDSYISNLNNLDTYEIDVGYPSSNIVLEFSVDNNESYSIFYEYSKKLSNNDYAERINDNGEIFYEFAPTIGSDPKTYKVTPASKNWWTKVTSYPISAKIVIKGLLRPSILLSYVKLNVLFYGKKHISSGIYVITKQVDRISSSGFTTTLSLTRVGGDEDVEVRTISGR